MKFTLKLSDSPSHTIDQVREAAQQNEFVALSGPQEYLSNLRNKLFGETEQESKVKPLVQAEERYYYWIDDKPLDLHRPYIDDVKFEVDGNVYERVEFTLDVWMDSGSMPFAQHHYPFANIDRFSNSAPGDFVSEYTGQIRAWFNVLHTISVGLFDQPAFRNVLVTGVLAGNDGRKMSKSLKNYPDPREILEKHGAEALRLYFTGNVLMKGEDSNFSEEDMIGHVRDYLLPLWNIYKYLVTYANMHEHKINAKTKFTTPMTKWITDTIDRSATEIRKHFDNYELNLVVKELRLMIDETSKWFIRANRSSFAGGNTEFIDALYYALKNICLVSAPIIPFTTERIYLDLIKEIENSELESIHMHTFPVPDMNQSNIELQNEMQLVRQVCELGQRIRTQNGLKVRQPLAVGLVSNENNINLPEWALAKIAEELNLKRVVANEVEMVAPLTETGWGIQLTIESHIDEELKKEGLMRELARAIQASRRNLGLEINSRINLLVHSESIGFSNQDFAAIKDSIKADNITISDNKLEDTVKGTDISFAIES